MGWPLSTSPLLQVYTPSRALRSADQLLLVVPKTKKKTRGLIYKGIYAQKMAYASFYAMFAIYKILT